MSVEIHSSTVVRISSILQYRVDFKNQRLSHSSYLKQIKAAEIEAVKRGVSEPSILRICKEEIENSLRLQEKKYNAH